MICIRETTAVVWIVGKSKVTDLRVIGRVTIMGDSPN